MVPTSCRQAAPTFLKMLLGQLKNFIVIMLSSPRGLAVLGEWIDAGRSSPLWFEFHPGVVQESRPNRPAALKKLAARMRTSARRRGWISRPVSCPGDIVFSNRQFHPGGHSPDEAVNCASKSLADRRIGAVQKNAAAGWKPKFHWRPHNTPSWYHGQLRPARASWSAPACIPARPDR